MAIRQLGIWNKTPASVANVSVNLNLSEIGIALQSKHIVYIGEEFMFPFDPYALFTW